MGCGESGGTLIVTNNGSISYIVNIHFVTVGMQTDLGTESYIIGPGGSATRSYTSANVNYTVSFPEWVYIGPSTKRGSMSNGETIELNIFE